MPFSMSFAKPMVMLPTARLLAAVAILPLLSALRHEVEHGTAELQASGHESKWTQCCVVDGTEKVSLTSSSFRREAKSILQDITYSGAYGTKDAFYTGRYVKHCKLALQFDTCPSVHPTLFNIYEYEDASKLVGRIDSFLAKYYVLSQTYLFAAPECPGSLQAAKDTNRCTSDFQHFMKLLSLWKDGMSLVEQVNKLKGFRGYFVNKEHKRTLDRKLENVMSQLEALW
ncbi:unnamed protein product [Symbiodinium natans]|uniref:Uncharacterized protein n=1 Tax=Symbiodinium natans TaxID=878477 RepID=A0A812R7M2_9DINO|nr:unnamed protein product [Symbiodinium natans]